MTFQLPSIVQLAVLLVLEKKRKSQKEILVIIATLSVLIQNTSGINVYINLHQNSNAFKKENYNKILFFIVICRPYMKLAKNNVNKR